MLASITRDVAEVKRRLYGDPAALERLKAAAFEFRRARRAFQACGPNTKPDTFASRRDAVRAAREELSSAFEAARTGRPIRVGSMLYVWRRPSLASFLEIPAWKAIDADPMAMRLRRGRHGGWIIAHRHDDGTSTVRRDLFLLVMSGGRMMYVARGTSSFAGVSIERWIDDEECERRMERGEAWAPGAISGSPYAEEFRRMRARWAQLRELFILE